MRYRIVEQLEDERSYVVVVENDGSTFGQIVDLRDCETVEQQDAKVLEAVGTARAISAAIKRKEEGRVRVPVINEEREVVNGVQRP